MMTQHHEIEPRHVETMAILDLDRTLLNTPVLVDMLLLQLHDHGFEPNEVRTHMEFIHSQAGASLSLRSFFEANFDDGESLYASVWQDILDLAKAEEALRHELLYVGTAELLDTLEQKDIPYAILTFGNELDQSLKLKLTRTLLEREEDGLSATITQVPNKARWVESEWVEHDGLQVPADIYGREPIVAENVVIADDKRTNLEATNPNVKGVLVDNTGATEGAMTIVELAAAIADGEHLVDLARHHEPAAA